MYNLNRVGAKRNKGDLMKKVQQYIMEHFKGEQPTMRVPSAIREPLIIYQCMRTCLMTAMENAVESVVIPGFESDND